MVVNTITRSRELRTYCHIVRVELTPLWSFLYSTLRLRLRLSSQLSAKLLQLGGFVLHRVLSWGRLNSLLDHRAPANRQVVKTCPWKGDEMDYINTV